MSENKEKETDIDPRYLVTPSVDYSQYTAREERSGNFLVNMFKNFGRWLSYAVTYLKDPERARLQYPEYTAASKEVLPEDPFARQIAQGAELNENGLPYGATIYNVSTGQTTTVPDKPVKPSYSGGGSTRNYSNRQIPNLKSLVFAGEKAATDVLLNFIGKYESGGNYSAIWPASEVPNLTNMTIKEVLAYQKEYAKTHDSAAIGKYQYTYDTLKSTYKKAGFTGDEKFDTATQDKLAIYTLKSRCDLGNFLQGKLTDTKFLNKVAKVWASIPDETGNSAYEGKLNKNLISKSDSLNILNKVKNVYTAEMLKLSQNGLYFSSPLATNFPLTSKWGIRNGEIHEGVDISVPIGTDLHAVADGTVAYAGPANRYGNVVIMNHGDNVYTLYGHLPEQKKNLTGKSFKRGDVFANSDNTGRSSGAHLHYEIMIRRGDAAYTIDPLKAAGKDLSKKSVQDDLIQDAKDRAKGHDPKSNVFGRVTQNEQNGLTSQNIPESGQDTEQKKINPEFNDKSDQPVAPDQTLASNNLSKQDMFRETALDLEDQTKTTKTADLTLDNKLG